MQVAPEVLEQARKLDAAGRERDDEIEIWPDMATGVLVFMAMDTQWLRDGTGNATGLNYQAIKPTAEMLELTMDQQAFHDLRTMEMEMLRLVREKRARR